MEGSWLRLQGVASKKKDSHWAVDEVLNSMPI